MDAATRHRLLVMAGVVTGRPRPVVVGRPKDERVETRAEPRDVGVRSRILAMLAPPPLVLDGECRAVLDALDDFEERRRDPLRVPRGFEGGGRFRSITDTVFKALKDWAKGEGPDDPFKDALSDDPVRRREQIRQIAKARGIEPRRGASYNEIANQILDQVRGDKDRPRLDDDSSTKKPTAAKKAVPAKKAAKPAAKKTAPAERPSGLPRKPVSGDFDDLAERVTGRPEEQIREVLDDLSATELAKLARKFPGGVGLRPGKQQSTDRSVGLRIPDGLTLDQRREWLAWQLSGRARRDPSNPPEFMRERAEAETAAKEREREKAAPKTADELAERLAANTTDPVTRTDILNVGPNPARLRALASEVERDADAARDPLDGRRLQQRAEYLREVADEIEAFTAADTSRKAEIKLDRAMGERMPTLTRVVPDHDASNPARVEQPKGRWKPSKTGRTGSMTFTADEGVYEANDRYGRKWYIVVDGEAREVSEEEADYAAQHGVRATPPADGSYTGPAFEMPAGVRQADVDALRAELRIPPENWTAGHFARRIDSEFLDGRLRELRDRLGPTVARRIAWEADAEIALARMVQLRRPEDPDEDPLADLPEVTDAELDALKEQVKAQLRREFAGKPIGVRVTTDGLGRILRDGRMKTMFETGRSGGLGGGSRGYREIRERAEDAFFGLGPDSDARERPIYGFVAVEGIQPAGSLNPTEPNEASVRLANYGDVQVILKDSVRSRTTATVGDSIDEHILPTPVDNPGWESFNPGAHGFRELEIDWRQRGNWIYPEAQVHGGVSVDDIEEVVFAAEPDDALKASLRRAGINWRVLPDSSAGRPKAPSPETYDERQRSVRDVADQPLSVESTIRREGTTTTVETTPDGRRVVRKRFRGPDAKRQADAEELGPLVVEAVGARAPATVRDGDDSVLIEHVEGEFGDSIVGFGQSAPSEVVDSDDARRIGLADYLTHSVDRNPGNWARLSDGRISTVDHAGMFLDENPDTPESVPWGLLGDFAGWLRGPDDAEGNPTLRADVDIPWDLSAMRKRLRALRPEFERLGRAEWHRQAMRLFDALPRRPRARGRAVLAATTDMLQRQVDSRGYIDVGVGVERHLGISRARLDQAVDALKARGYTVHSVQVPQVGGKGKTTVKVLAPPGTSYRDVDANKSRIGSVVAFSDDRGLTYEPIRAPLSVDSSRLQVRYADDGGADADGVVYVRPGVADLSLGGGRYAQVRIAVDGTHYIKGMAVYSDDLPDGVDLVFHTKKRDTGTKTDALKPLKRDPETGEIDLDDPFGTTIRRQILDDDGQGGKRVASAMNLVYEEGSWSRWSRSLSSQVLAKQSPELARAQLGVTRERRRRELDDILALEQPVVRRELLREYAEGTDSAAVDLAAAALPRQAWHVILPVGSLPETEVYAPGYRNGERVALIRHPHGGTFEIPDLVVNNDNPEARRLLGDARDAVGIHPAVAARLSGADFDGDTVLVIPHQGEITTSPPLEGLADFDPSESYPGYPGMTVMSEAAEQTQMGVVSNLITDMTIQGAPPDEIVRAVRHSMVVIDARKHKLDYRRSAAEHGIAELRRKYQGRAGAATLVSKASSETDVPARRPRPAAQGGPIDPATGRLMFDEPETWVDAEGKTRTRTRKAKRLAVAEDARTLISAADTEIERIYAEHSNALKAMADEARREMVAIGNVRWDPAARAAHAERVATLRAKLDIALRNAPVERQAQIIANAIVERKMRAAEGMSKAELAKYRKRVEAKALREARQRVGAGKTRITITDEEWAAIQAGALSDDLLTKILANADPARVRALATPRAEAP